MSLIIAAVRCIVATINRLTIGDVSVPRPARPVTERVTVCVPARDEAETLPALIADLAAQRGLADLRVIVHDDCSTDATAAVAAAAMGTDPRFELVGGPGARPPEGWLGKSWALQQMTTANPGLLCLLDADVRLQPDAVAAAVHTFLGLESTRGVGLLSVWPTQLAGSAVEHLLQPLLCWSWFATLPVRICENRRSPSTAVAIGQFLVLRDRRLREVGGYTAVAAEIAEDMALARLFRRAGTPTALRFGGGLTGCRMHAGARSLGDGHTRWLAAEFGSPSAVSAVGVLAAAEIWPLFGLAVGRRRRLAVSAFTLSAVTRVLARSAEAGRTGASDLVSALLHPVGVGAATGLLIGSLRRTRAGRLRWRGRDITAS